MRGVCDGVQGVAQRRWRPLALAMLAMVVSSMAFGAATAGAVVDIWWTSGQIAPGGRVVGPYKYHYGVGYTTSIASSVSDNVCVGAKTNADGSGGNAIPFVCGEVAPDTAMWTAGGNSNWGYPTIINNESYIIWGGGLRNYRP